MPEGPPYKDAQSVPKGNPTPTQSELDAIALGDHPEIAPDGTPPDPNQMQHDPRATQRDREARQRQTTPQATRPIPPRTT
jgi:hypothetical protein